jgi:hypothetical protein
MNSVVFTADTHFDDRGAWINRGITGDTEFAFEQIVTYCESSRASALLIGGDILNRAEAWPELIRFLHNCFDRLKAAHVQVHYVLGQHDGRRNWLKVHGWPTYVHGQTFGIGDAWAIGLDWMPAPDARQAIASLTSQSSNAGILFTHQVWAELCDKGQGDQLRIADLPASIHTVLTGDYHESVVKIVNRAHAGPVTVRSPGPIAQQAIDEQPAKSFDVQDGTGQWTSRPLRSRPFQRFDFTQPGSSLDGVANWLDQALLASQDLPEALRTPIVQIRHLSEDRETPQQARQRCAGRAHLFLAVTRDQSQVAAGETVKGIRAWGLEGALPSVLDARTHEHRLALALLGAPDLREEYEQQQRQYHEAGHADCRASG